MKNKQLEFYNFMKTSCEYKKLGFDKDDVRCIKSKKDIKQCNINNCFFVKQENKGLLNPAMELLRILEIEYIHIPKTKTGKHDVLKSNEGLPDLIMFFDNFVYFVELKVNQNKLSDSQKKKAEKLSNKNYSKYDVMNNLQDFYYNVLSYLSEREVVIMSRNYIKMTKWMQENNVEDGYIAKDDINIGDAVYFDKNDKKLITKKRSLR
jgi:hypothetical protein